MNKLTECSQILYDTEIIENNKQIYLLKKKFLPNSLNFNTTHDWLIIKNQFIKNLTDKILLWSIERHQDILNNKIFWIWLIYDILLDELILITRNKEWSENISIQIVRSIHSSIYSLDIINKLQELQSFELSMMITHNIIDQLFNQNDPEAFPCIFNNIINTSD